MAFPNDIETGVGLAGPTANIGHADAHAANGVPRMLELLQTTIGTNTATQLYTPTWPGNTTPQVTNQVYWNRIANTVFVNCNFRWNANTGSIPITQSWLFEDFPAGWGNFKQTSIMGRGSFGGENGVTIASLTLSRPSARSYINSFKRTDTVNAFYIWESFQTNDYFTGSGVLVVE